MPAVRIEEAVINRLMEITKDWKLLTQLAQDSQTNTVDRTAELEQLINTKEQAKRNVERQIDNLLTTIADLPTGVNPKTILTKVAEFENHKEQLAEALGMLRQERSQAKGRVINLEQVFKLFRIFERGFGDRPVQLRQLARTSLKVILLTVQFIVI